MFQTTVEIGGMACGMCEAHINDAVRAAFPVKKVSSSHKKGRAVIVSQNPLDPNKLRQVIEAAGYTVSNVVVEPAPSGGWFRFLKR